MKQTLIRVILMIAVLALLAACGGGGEQTTPTAPAGAATEPGPATETSGAPTEGASGETPQLTGRTWTWVRTEMSDGTVIEPRKPEEFTITLADNGQVTGTTDCNDFTGTYTTGEGGILAFEPFVSTMMLCENSQETDFVSRLQEVQSYMFNEGQLVMQIQMDSGQIIFQ